MIIGVPKERRRNEYRVGLTRQGVQALVQAGHTVIVEHDAGVQSHYTDQDYSDAGAKIAYNADEAYQRADLVCRVGPLDSEEVGLLRPDSIVCGFLQATNATRDQINKICEKRVTLIGYELVELNGRRTVLKAIAEIAGHLAVHTAAHLLEANQGGRGLLLGGVPGIPPSAVVILGAGTGGRAAARIAVAMDTHVILIDSDYDKLRRAHYEIPGTPVTVTASQRNLQRYTAIADAVIGAVFNPGRKSPVQVTEEMVKGMKPGSVIVDLSLGLGNCIATSRPTELDSPTFKVHGVTHYCVPNITAAVPRTTSRAVATAAMPYLTSLTQHGLPGAFASCPGLRPGIYVYQGKCVHEHVAAIIGATPTPLPAVAG
jgi:alanine dehydrogenase